MKIIPHLKKYALYVLLFLILSSFTYQKYSNHEKGWRSELWADQGGYYVLLPSLFIYNFDAKQFPKNIEAITGYGFVIDTVENKISTKYTYGVALLQAPFFLFIHYCTNLPKESQNGFSDLYYQVPNLASLFYSFIGIVLLIKFLKQYFSDCLSVITALCIFFGTNVFYYSTDSSGMSHIYSFCLFTLFFYLTGKLISASQNKKIIFLFWAIAFSIIFLVRPINFVIIFIPIFLNCNSTNGVLLRIKEFTNWKYLLIFTITFSLFLLPQSLYWKYLTGNWIYYGYRDETFSNWNAPKIIELLFSPNNGLFLYTPLFIIILGGMIYMIIKKINNGILVLSMFLLLLYIGGAWFIVSLGCSYSDRALVEYASFFALPLGHIIHWLHSTQNKIRILLAALIFIGVLFNFKLIYSFDKCFAGSEWDFKEYSNLILRGGYYKKIKVKDSNLTSEKEFSEGIFVNQRHYTLSSFRCAMLSADVELHTPITNAELFFIIEKNNSIIYCTSLKLNTNYNKFIPKHYFSMTVDIPKAVDLDCKISTFVWNKEKKNLKLNSLSLQLR